MTAPPPIPSPLAQLIKQWRANADMLAEGNKDEGFDPSVGMQRACADQLEAVILGSPQRQERTEDSSLDLDAITAAWEHALDEDYPHVALISSKYFGALLAEVKRLRALPRSAPTADPSCVAPETTDTRVEPTAPASSLSLTAELNPGAVTDAKRTER